MDTKRDEHPRPGMRVVDKRKFNTDGSRREGVDEPEAAAEPDSAAEGSVSPSPEEQLSGGESAEAAPQAESQEGEAAPERGTPLLSLMYSLATSAQIALGEVENPATGGRYVNIEEAQGYIDILADLERKTRGNLTPPEARFLQSALYELRLRFTARQQEILTRRKPS